ncbi:hypothetical protein V5799_024895 [Amblyomma americanum]|uniref:Hyaluronan-mediated motility receptor C-terminal domain-containing protein n=1 Tax=Amblyomma americanum TaxID=6943 RepID=A0AAQ4EB41_AMBAM
MLAEVKLSKGTAELKEEIEKFINDFRDDDANNFSIGSDSDDLAREKDLEHAFEKLYSENEKLVITVGELQCEVKALKNHHEDLEGKHAKLIEQAVNHENEKSKLQKKFNEIMTEKEALMENVKRLQAENCRLECAYSSIALRCEEIESQLDEVSCEDACLRSLLHDRGNEILVLEQHKQDLLEKLGEFESVISTMVDAEQELSSRLSDLESLHSRNKELSSMKMNLEQELKMVKDALHALEDEKRMTERDLTKLLEDKSVLQESNQSYLAKHAQLEKELFKTKHELEVCQSEAKHLSGENCRLTKELSAVISSHEVTVLKNRELEKSLDGVSKEKNTMEEHLASVTDTLKTVEASLNQVNAEHLKLRHEKACLEEEVCVIRGRNEELNASKTSLQMQLSGALAQLSAAERCKQQLQEELALTEEAKHEAIKDALHKDKALKSLESQNNNLAKALLEQQKLCSKLEMELVSLQDAADLLQARNEELQFSTDASKLQFSVAERRANKYKLVCSELDLQKRDLCDQIKQLSEELTELRDGTQVAAGEFNMVMVSGLSWCLSLENFLFSSLAIYCRQVAGLTEQLKDKTVEAEKWKFNFEALQLRVAPFQGQLELYEMEKELLERRNEATESELTKLHRKVSEMMGHQNHRQKIHYLSNLLKERNEYKKEVYTLHEKMLKQMKEIKKLEVLLQQRGRKSVLELSTKENLDPPA